MTRPHIVRADSIDLQDHEAPSAKDHSKPHPNGPSSLAPHQAETLREVAQETAEENLRSPRVSWVNGDAAGDLQQYAEDLAAGVASSLNGGSTANGANAAGSAARTMQQQDALAVAQNGGLSGSSDEGGLDEDTDDGMDDDMMDKISSSPSIEDGGSTPVTHPGFWPRRVDSLPSTRPADSPTSSPAFSDARSSSPYLETPQHLPVHVSRQHSKASAAASPSQNHHLREDIDFEFVYALHTFIATVEGQANATKGDTMVLLDDSNSYWWLVRVVKDSSIGYLPAEHIETPTERLARLNKHRNIDLSATMLGDQAGEKSKSTFKVALRGRKKKTVTFTAPTYVDYSDIDYSTEEEDMDELFAQQQQAAQQQQQAAAQQSAAAQDMDDDSAKVEPLKPRVQKEVKIVEPTKEDSKEDADTSRTSDEIFDSKPDGPSRSRNGTVRNTDSFFKDETVETKKITLTPNLLRDDNTPRPSTDSKELKSRPSLDRLNAELQPDKKEDKKKKDKDKKEKDKKPSAIRSFFSRKDKKRSPEEDDDSFGKRSVDITTESQDRESDEQAEEQQVSPEKGPVLQRNPSKLQKQQPRIEPSPTRTKGAGPPQPSTTIELANYINSEGRTNDVSNVPPTSMRIVDQSASEPQDASGQRPRDRSPEATRSVAAAVAAVQQKEEKSGLSKMMSRTPSTDKPQKVHKAKARVELDDFDSPDEEVAAPEPVVVRQTIEEKPRQEKQLRPTLPGSYPDSYLSTQTTASNQSDKTITPMQTQVERLSESPVQVSPVTSHDPPALMVDTSSQEGHSSESPSPELIDIDGEARHRGQDSITTSSTSTGASSTGNTWNDAKLRAFFDSSSDIRDMLVVVYDKSDVAPAGPDHPVAGPLFREQNAKLAEITTQLDNMLGDWLARKQRLRGTV